MPITFVSLTYFLFPSLLLSPPNIYMLVYYRPSPAPSQWKLPESGVYIWLAHLQAPFWGLTYSRCSVNRGRVKKDMQEIDNDVSWKQPGVSPLLLHP